MISSNQFHIISTELLAEYLAASNAETLVAFEQLKDVDLSIDTFSFYTSVSAVYSSKIEGENIELDSYIKHKRFGAHFLPDYTKKIDDLYDAYIYAQTHDLTADNLKNVHAILTKHILQKQEQGKFRKGNMYVVTKDGKIEYVAANADVVETEMNKLFHDIESLLNTTLSFDEVIFFASMLHLVFVKIHPFEDGNGRTARLLEKWFIAARLGNKAWYIQSEKFYYDNHQTYYHYLRQLGLEYIDLNYSKALNFLQMLPQALLVE